MLVSGAHCNALEMTEDLGLARYVFVWCQVRYGSEFQFTSEVKWIVIQQSVTNVKRLAILDIGYTDTIALWIIISIQEIMWIIALPVQCVK